MLDFAGNMINEGECYIPITGQYKGNIGRCISIRESFRMSQTDRVTLHLNVGITKSYSPNQIVKSGRK